MKLAICLVSPQGFVYSEGFRDVAQCLQAAAIELGHDAIITTRTDLPDRTSIVLGPNLLARWPQPLAKGAILYNLEQAEPSEWFAPEVLALFRTHPVWDYSEHNAGNVEKLGVPRPRVLPIGWNKRLERIWSQTEDIDVLFYGSLNARRTKLLEELKKRGARVEIACGVFGAKRDELIARSRLVLNIHYFESKVFEVVRVSYLIGNGRAVVSETGAAQDEEAPYAESVSFAPYEKLVDRCLELIRKPAVRARLGASGRALMRLRPMAKSLKQALHETLG